MAIWLAAARPAPAASLSRTLTGTATVAGLAKLSLSPTSLTFPDSDPNTTPSIPASGGPIAITASGRTTFGATITLTVLSSDDLRSGTDIIPASALTWSASGGGFVNGTMSKTAAQTIGSWLDSGSRVGSQTFILANSWSYPTGTYTATLTYTLTAP